MISSIGAFGFGLSQLLFVYLIFKSIRGGAKATRQRLGQRRRTAWNGRCARRRRITASKPRPK